MSSPAQGLSLCKIFEEEGKNGDDVQLDPQLYVLSHRRPAVVLSFPQNPPTLTL